MSLSPLIEFIAAREVARGTRIAHTGASYVETVVPANTTVWWDLTPGPNFYMSYIFRMLLDKSIVPGTFRGRVYVYGTMPFFATIQGSIGEVYIDYFLRLFHNTPLRTEVTNLTNLNQRWISIAQVLQISSEEDYWTMESLIEQYYGGEHRMKQGA